MPVLEIQTIPAPVLKLKASAVKNIDAAVISLCSDMTETIRHLPHCVGIAAPQIGRSTRIVVVDVSLNHKPQANHGLLILINPVITSSAGARMGREGCLSIPDFTANVTRTETVTVEYLNLQGEKKCIEASGFEAVVLQHEIDHLNGILFLDRVSSLKTDVFRRKTR